MVAAVPLPQALSGSAVLGDGQMQRRPCWHCLLHLLTQQFAASVDNAQMKAPSTLLNPRSAARCRAAKVCCRHCPRLQQPPGPVRRRLCVEARRCRRWPPRPPRPSGPRAGGRRRCDGGRPRRSPAATAAFGADSVSLAAAAPARSPHRVRAMANHAPPGRCRAQAPPGRRRPRLLRPARAGMYAVGTKARQ